MQHVAASVSQKENPRTPKEKLAHMVNKRIHGVKRPDTVPSFNIDGEIQQMAPNTPVPQNTLQPSLLPASTPTTNAIPTPPLPAVQLPVSPKPGKEIYMFLACCDRT